MKKLHLAVAVVGIAAVGTAAYWLQHRDTRIAAAAPATAAAPASGAGARSASGPAVVEVAKVETTTLTDDAQAVGSLQARQSVTVRPEVSGRIHKLGFVDGAPVKRGQLLVQLDATLQAAQLQQAQAQARIAQTNLDRSRELLAQNFISQSAVDQNAATQQVAQAQVALAQAQLAKMRIVAPFDGVAGIRSVHVGSYVKDGDAIVTLEDTGTVFVDFRLPERFLARLKAKQAVEVSLDALPGRSFTGQVDAVDTQIDADGRALLVRGRLDNPEGELRSGMFARARVVFSRRDNALVVPEEALVPVGGKQYLVKVVDAPDGRGKVSQRIEARLGARLPGKVEILDGLRPGDTVVTAGHGALMRGEALPLRVVEIGARAPAPASAPGSATGGAVAARAAPA
jgi:membrane fusion protein (multidrug efflux system)